MKKKIKNDGKISLFFYQKQLKYFFFFKVKLDIKII